MLVGIPSFPKALAQHPDPFRGFLPLLKSQSNEPEAPIPLLASNVLTSILSATSTLHAKGDSALPSLYKYLSTLTKLSDGGLQDIAVLEYSTLLRGNESRSLFWDQRKDTVGPLIDILKAAAGVSNDSSSSLWNGGGAPSVRGSESLGGGVSLQLLYHVLLVLWQLSFEGAIIGDEFDE